MTKPTISITCPLDDSEALNRCSLLLSGMSLDAYTPAAAPAVPAAPAAAPAADVELDTDGVPWDARIHSSTKNKTVKGVWKIARGTDKSLIDAVLAEHEISPVVPAAPQLYVIEGSGKFTRDQLISSGWDDDQIDDLEIAGKTTFPEFLKRLNASDLSVEQIGEVLLSHGIESTPLLAAAPHLIPVIENELFGNG